jgi:hypothetical protein
VQAASNSTDPDSHRDRRRDAPFTGFSSIFNSTALPYSAAPPALGVRTTQDARAALSSAYVKRQKRKRGCGCSARCCVAFIALAITGLWAAFMLQRFLRAAGLKVEVAGNGPSNVQSAALDADPDLWPDDVAIKRAKVSEAVLTAGALTKDAGTAPAPAAALAADTANAPNVPLATRQSHPVSSDNNHKTAQDDAYALQRLQAAVDEDAGSWDSGSIGAEAARAAVRDALLRDHEAALAKDVAAHTGGGESGVDHSAAHHHDGVADETHRKHA